MKKTAAKPKKVTKKTTKPVLAVQPIFFQRIIVITTSLVLVVAAIAFMNRQNVNSAVAGTSIMRGSYLQSTVTLPTVTNAVAYNIYYKQSGKNFTNAVRNIPLNVHTYTISYLKKNTQYEYRIAALDATGKEFYFSNTKPLSIFTSM